MDSLLLSILFLAGWQKQNAGEESHLYILRRECLAINETKATMAPETFLIKHNIFLQIVLDIAIPTELLSRRFSRLIDCCLFTAENDYLPALKEEKDCNTNPRYL